MPTIARHAAVRVATLTGSGEDHLILRASERSPRVGDVGVVVDVTPRLGGVGRHVTVRARDGEGRTVWLAVFAAHELELVT